MKYETKDKETVKGKVVVYSTEEGKLYIDPAELFSLPSIQDLIEKAVKSKALENVNKVALKDG